MERIINALIRFTKVKFINPTKIFDIGKMQSRKAETYDAFAEHPRPRPTVKFTCKPANVTSNPDLKSLILLIEKESGEIEEEILNSRSSWKNKQITNLMIEADGSLVIIMDEDSEVIHKNDVITRDNQKAVVLDYVSLVQEFSDSEIETILDHESKNGAFDFHEILKRYNISNFGALITAIQRRLESGLIERDLTLNTDVTKDGLTKCFIENVCCEYTPLVYHEFQVPLIENLFAPSHDQDIIFLKDAIMKSRYYSFEQVKADFLEKSESMGKDARSKFLVELRKILSGATLVNYPDQGSYWHPAWFDEDFTARWHVKLPAMVSQIIEEHFPLVYDRSLHGFKEFLLDTDLIKERLGALSTNLEHLFKLPILNLVVRDPVMRWDWVNPSYFYDGVLMMEGKDNLSNAEGFDVMGLKTRYVAYSIAIHPLQLLCAEDNTYEWNELVMQTLHHELVHVLQMRFVQNVMTGLYLKNPGMKKTRSIKQNLSYLDAIRDKLDVDDVLDLINKVNETLYIREFVPASESKKLNLEDYVNGMGGHTDAFLDIVKSFKHCKIAWKQRMAFFEFIQAFAHRITGKNFNRGLTFLCKE